MTWGKISLMHYLPDCQHERKIAPLHFHPCWLHVSDVGMSAQFWAPCAISLIVNISSNLSPCKDGVAAGKRIKCATRVQGSRPAGMSAQFWTHIFIFGWRMSAHNSAHIFFAEGCQRKFAPTYLFLLKDVRGKIPHILFTTHAFPMRKLWLRINGLSFKRVEG